MKNIACFLIVFCAYQNSIGQDVNTANSNDHEKMVKEKMALFSDYFKSGNYDKARAPLDWLLENQPDISLSIYINGIKLCEALEQSEKNVESKFSLQEKILGLYDKRMEYFQDEDNVINRKAYAAYKFYRNREDKYAELLHLFDDAFKRNEQYILSASLLAYMDVMKKYQESNGSLTKEDILERYHRISEVHTMKNADSQIMDEVDKILLSLIEMNCDEIHYLFGNFADVQGAKKLMAISLTFKCTSHLMFLEAALQVFDDAPNAGLARIIATLYETKQNVTASEKYLLEALRLSDNSKAPEINFLLAVHYQKRDLLQKSRFHALKAAKSSEYSDKAYRLIGDLYVSSYNSCMGGKSRLVDQGVYLAAYEMYQKAGDQEKMEMISKHFPSAEDIHAENLKIGDQIQVCCWINEMVTIRRRP